VEVITRKTGPTATSEPLVSPPQLLADFDLHFEIVTNDRSYRVANLLRKIPIDYPLEDFLGKHFSSPPFELLPGDCERALLGGVSKWQIRESRKPSTFFSLFRFLEFFRISLLGLKQEMTLLGQLREKVNFETKNQETTPLAEGRGVKLENAKRVLEVIHTRAKLISDRSDQVIELFYRKVVSIANASFKNGAFNLYHLYPVKTMAMKFFPHYDEAMILAIEMRETLLKIHSIRGGN